MKKLYRDLRVAHSAKLLHFADVSHLIHVAIDTALHSSAMNELRKVAIKFGALFKHAHKLELQFREICMQNGLNEEEVCKPPVVVSIRWYSFYES